MDGACISGPDTLTVEANSVSNYPLTFAPTLIGDTTAQSVSTPYHNVIRTCIGPHEGLYIISVCVCVCIPTA